MATAKKNLNNTNNNKAKNMEYGSSNNSESTPDQVHIIEDTLSNFLIKAVAENQKIQIIDPKNRPSPVERLMMFQKLNNTMEGIQKGLAELHGTKKKVELLITNQGLQQEKVVDLTHYGKNCHMRMDIMVNTIIRQEE